MQYKITFKNPKTGEDESLMVTAENCYEILGNIFSKMIPDGKIKPVNFKLELILGSE